MTGNLARPWLRGLVAIAFPVMVIVIATTIACLAAFLAAKVAIIVRGRKRDVPA